MSKRMLPRDKSRVFRDCVTYINVLAESSTKIRAAEDLSVALPIVFTIDNQPDVPRTFKWLFTSHAQITAYTVEVKGYDAQGILRTERWTENLGWSGETNIAFSYITSIKMTSRTGTGVGDTMHIGTGSMLGMPNPFASTVNVVITKNQACWLPPSWIIFLKWGKIDVSSGGAIVDGDDFIFWYDAFY